MAIESKREYQWLFDLIKRQTTMLSGKDASLSELYHLCDDDSQRLLISDLLIRFDCIDDDLYNMALRSIAKKIAELKYDVSELAVVAMSMDSAADSSQAMLNDIKIYLTDACGSNVQTINKFSRIQKAFKREGKKHFVVIDEFSGSGQTVLNRYTEFGRYNLEGATLDFFLIAALRKAYENVKSQGIHVDVELLSDAGISAYYTGDVLHKRKDEMKLLEGKLADQIGELKLKDYSFGYAQSEALYARKDHNVPNNVFPLFWWKQYKGKRNRLNVLFTRVQDGY